MAWCHSMALHPSAIKVLSLSTPPVIHHVLVLCTLLIHLCHHIAFNYFLTSASLTKNPSHRYLQAFFCGAEALQQITSTVSSGLASASAFPGVQAGSVVITDRAVDARFQPRFEQVVLGDVVVRGTDLDGGLVEELLACSEAIPDFPTLVGHTMCTYDFYEGKTCFGCPFPRGALT